MANINWVQMMEVMIVSTLCGVVGTATRNALDLVRITRHPHYSTVAKTSKDKLHKIPYAWRRHLVGITTAFVATVTLGLEQDILHQCVIALIASLSGTTFLIHHMEEGANDSDLYVHLENQVNRDIESLVADLHAREGNELQAAAGEETRSGLVE